MKRTHTNVAAVMTLTTLGLHTETHTLLLSKFTTRSVQINNN